MKRKKGMFVAWVTTGFFAAFFSMAAFAQEENPVPSAIPKFLEWAQQYATSPDRLATEADGIRLAEARRAALKELIRSNPKQALEQKLSDNLEATLPKAVAALLEKKVSGRGKFSAIAGILQRGKSAPAIVRKATIDGKNYDAFVYGKLNGLTSREEVWMSGIAVDNVIALDENSTPEAAAATEPSPATEGNKRLLLIRVDFSDFQGIWFSQADGTNQITELNNFFTTSSYGRAGFNLAGAGSAVTPLLRMPKQSTLYPNDFTLFVDDARSAATVAGYNLTNYDYYVVCFPSYPTYPYCGQGRVGEAGAIVTCFNTGVFAHELGHNFGLWHANFWDTSGQSVIGPGASVEYGDRFDTMGLAGADIYHFNARYKNILNWLRTNEVTTVASNGTYRIKAQDDSTITGVRALKIVKNVNTNYWVDFRQKFTFNKWSMNGVGLHWGGNNNEPTLLLDTTPGSPDSIDDSPLVAGRTFSDTVAGIHVTALRKAGTVPEAFDVVVNLGTFPTNVAPNVTITPGSTNIPPGSTVTLQASASDSNGDALAYYWDFGDGDFGTNGVVQTHTWNFTGAFSVRCIVSDMKGGTKTNVALVNVGFPPNILTQPRNQSTALGGTATFSVGANGEPLNYFWRKNGTAIAGATSSIFSLSNVQATNVGQYSVVVSNAFGSVTSSNAFLRVGTLQTFSNSTPIGIPLNNPSTPYPSTIFVSGVTQTVLKVTATLNSLTHEYPGDLDILLSNPSSDAIFLMSDVGYGSATTNTTLTMDDDAPFSLLSFGLITNGIYQPTDYESFDNLPAPAPPSPYFTNLAALAAGTPNGTWSLFVSDDYLFANSGTLGGWTLNFLVASNVPPTITTQPASRTNFTSYNTTFSVKTIGSAPLKYQWRKNGSAISSATASTYTITNVQTNHAGNYSVFVTNLFGTTLSADAILTVMPNIAIGEAVDSPALAWSSGGNAQWFGQSNITHNSSDAGASGSIYTSQETWLETSVTGPGTVTFWWKVSSEQNYDFLQFLVNGVEQRHISGYVDWEQQIFYLPAGNQTLRWRYFKDFSVNAGDDRGWLDQMFFTPGGTAPSILTQPVAQTISQGSSANFTVAAQGTSPFRFQWRKNNLNISGATNANLLITNSQTNHTGNYSVVVQNDYNSVTSSNAFLLVLQNLFFDDFEPGIDFPQWSLFGGEVRATNYGGSVSGNNSLWFNGNESRFATTKPINLVAGGTIQFYLRFAIGLEFPWERIDLPEEGVVLEYSLNGTNWTTLALFNTYEFFDWTRVQIPLPSEVSSSGTLFRWRQTSHSGAGLDHWALDDVQITVSPLAFGAIQKSGPGSFSFLIAGPSGQSCVILTSTNLINWTPMSTNVLTNGTLIISNTISLGQPRRFYRATLAP